MGYTRYGLECESLRGAFCRSNLLVFKGLLPWPAAGQALRNARNDSYKITLNEYKIIYDLPTSRLPFNSSSIIFPQAEISQPVRAGNP
jgi:hypothetical protein